MSARIFSQQVSWWSVHEFVERQVGTAVPSSFPVVGSSQWCALPDDDPAKWAAVLDAAQHWALRLETCQQALAEASRDVSAAADWPSIAREIHGRSTCYIRREAS